MKYLRYLLASLGLLGSTVVCAYTGNDLLADSETQKAGTMRYVKGVIDGITASQMASRKEIVCIPEGVTVGQSTDVVLNELRKTPANRHLDAGAIVYVALMTTWPCKLTPSGPAANR